MKTRLTLPVLLGLGLLAGCGGNDDNGSSSSSSSSSVQSSSSSESSSSSSSESSSSESSSSESSSSESSSSVSAVSWNVYDGLNSPFAAGALTLADGTEAEFALDGNAAGMDATYFTVVGDGTTDFNTAADASHEHVAVYENVVNNSGTYPKHLTVIAGVKGPMESSRVLDIEMAMADAGVAGSRLKAIIRADDANTGVQLERATNGGLQSSDSVSNYTISTLNEFHVYHFAVELTSATHGNVSVYLDGASEPLENLHLENVEFRVTSNDGDNFLRFGDAGGSAYAGNVDWLIWTNEDAYTPTELEGALPADMGCVLGYGAQACEAGSSSSSSSSSESSSSSSAAAQPDYGFEADVAGEAPSSATSTSGPVVVSTEQAKSGTQAVKMTRLNTGENVNMRYEIAPAATGELKLSVYVPATIANSGDVYITVFEGGYSSDPNKTIDVILTSDGRVRNRVNNSQVTIDGATYVTDDWNDLVLSWTDLPTSNTYNLTINGTDLGTLDADKPGKTPDRFEVKFGSSSSPLDPNISIYVDDISAF